MTPEPGLALMNLEFHGWTDSTSANALCDRGLLRSKGLTLAIGDGLKHRFEVVELELDACLEISRIRLAEAIRHPFIQEAFARMRQDQHASAAAVVFEASYLLGLVPADRMRACYRTAYAWRR